MRLTAPHPWASAKAPVLASACHKAHCCQSQPAMLTGRKCCMAQGPAVGPAHCAEQALHGLQQAWLLCDWFGGRRRWQCSCMHHKCMDAHFPLATCMPNTNTHQEYCCQTSSHKQQRDRHSMLVWGSGNKVRAHQPLSIVAALKPLPPVSLIQGHFWPSPGWSKNGYEPTGSSVSRCEPMASLASLACKQQLAPQPHVCVLQTPVCYGHDRA